MCGFSRENWSMDRIKTRILKTVFLLPWLAWAGAGAGELPPLAPKSYWISVTPSPFAAEETRVLFDKPETWSRLRGAVDHYKYFGRQLVPGHQNHPLDPEAFASLLTKDDIRIGVEFGHVFVRPNVPADSHWKVWLEEAIAEIQPVFDAGFEVHTLHFDGPVRRILGHGGGGGIAGQSLPYPEAIEQLARWWVAVGERYPNMKLGVLPNLPNWDYAEDSAGYVGHFSDDHNGLTFEKAVTDLHDRVKEKGGRIDFIEIDCPHGYYGRTRTRHDDAPVDNAGKFRRIAKWCRDRNMQWHLIVNQEIPRLEKKQQTPEKLRELSEKYRRGTAAYLRRLRRDGLFPDVFLLESWYIVPHRQVPDSAPGTWAEITLENARLIRELFPHEASP